MACKKSNNAEKKLHQLFQLLTKYNADACVYLGKVEKHVRKSGGRYSTIADGTQDSSKMEAIVALIRYIEGLSSDIMSPLCLTQNQWNI